MSIFKFTLIIFFIICYSLALNSVENPWNKLDDLYINLAASTVFILVTLIIVDSFISSDKNKKYKLAHSVAKEELLRLRNQLVMYVANPLGHEIRHTTPDTINENVQQVLSQMLVLNYNGVVTLLKVDQWKHIQLNLVLIRTDLLEKLFLYKDLVPPKILGALLTVNREFQSLYTLFGLFSDLLTKEEKDWPINEYGHARNAFLRGVYLIKLSDQFPAYFRAVESLTNVLFTW